MKFDIPSLLSSDARFLKRGQPFQKACYALSEVFCDFEVSAELGKSFKHAKNIAYFLNILQYANLNNDSIAYTNFTRTEVIAIMQKGFPAIYHYEELSEVELKSVLKSDYIDYKDISSEEIDESKNKFLHQILNQSKFEEYPSFPIVDINSNIDDSEYWIQSVSLDFPYIPQPDGNSKAVEFQNNSQVYCLYKEAVLPWNQSQITALTDCNAFSDSDILKLFPQVRLYTRSPYMYQKYDGLDYDEDLGVILKIKGFTKKQITKNIIEYPHISYLDRWVKQKGKDVTIPFWKHIEIDGEIVPTASVWDKLSDTKKLPQTESFMNEYVVRKYLLERDKGIEHKYPLRGELDPFLTLYASPKYYEGYGYDPLTIGRQCVSSRVSFKRSRNPILKMLNAGE